MSSVSNVTNQVTSTVSGASKETPEGASGLSQNTKSSSHTKFYKMSRHDASYKVVSRQEYLSISESVSGSSDTFQCVHGPEGKIYTKSGLLKRNLLKQLDPIPFDHKRTEKCQVSVDWGLAQRIEFLVLDPSAGLQAERLADQLGDLVNISTSAFRVDTLSSLCVILEYLKDSAKIPALKKHLTALLHNLDKPILLTAASDVITYFSDISCFLDYLGYLLMMLEEQGDFELVSRALLWQLSAPDAVRGRGAAARRHCLAAATPALLQTAARMVALASADRFHTYMQIALLLACDTADNCLFMMEENLIEHIFYRFNPYFPERTLPEFDINPADCQDGFLKLGDSSTHIATTLSLLMVLLKTTRELLEVNPKLRVSLPCPDSYALRCFTWAYRYECRARAHRHERGTLTVLAALLLDCFGDRLTALSSIFMPDVTSLSVLTELPARGDWTDAVHFNTGQQDLQFKKVLIYLVVDMLKVFPFNKFVVESRMWLMGLTYLLDPGLCPLRARWSLPLFAELRKVALQALVCSLPLCNHKVIEDYGIIRRLLWYVEWYSESPFELQTLYWCLRVLHAALRRRHEPCRPRSLKTLFDTHGVIVLMQLCKTLLEQKLPPVEKSQAVLSVALRMLTSCVQAERRLSCRVYPHLQWPATVYHLATNMLDIVLHSLENHCIISDRWLVALLNLVWESIVWHAEFRRRFVADDGIYKLLDIITMGGAPVQCVALALLCDVARAGLAAPHLVSWRAALPASSANPNVVKRGATIASLLAAVFRDECKAQGIPLTELGLIEDMDYPIVPSEGRGALQGGAAGVTCSFGENTPCLSASDIAGSRMPKTFALLHMLSEDLEHKVDLADEAYNLYKNIKLSVQDEITLVMCSHYLTLQLCAAWRETSAESELRGAAVPEDQALLQEFLHIARGWAKEVRRRQEDVIEQDRKKEREEEMSLYTFLRRVRLTMALEALRWVRCAARSGGRLQRAHALLLDAVRAHQRRVRAAARAAGPVLRTYSPALDECNVTGQNLKVFSNQPKENLRTYSSTNSSD